MWLPCCLVLALVVFVLPLSETWSRPGWRHRPATWPRIAALGGAPSTAGWRVLSGLAWVGLLFAVLALALGR